MTGSRRLSEPLRAFRIGDPEGRWRIYSADGARSVHGRWHRRGDRVIYASEHYSTAMLEMLVRWSGVPPANQHFIEILVPADTSYEVVDLKAVPGWHLPESPSARRFGHDWHVQRRSAILRVPSVVTRMERNVIIDADHPEFALLRAGPEMPVRWDERLFG